MGGRVLCGARGGGGREHLLVTGCCWDCVGISLYSLIFGHRAQANRWVQGERTTDCGDKRGMGSHSNPLHGRQTVKCLQLLQRDDQ